jgi:hypothetical protein
MTAIIYCPGRNVSVPLDASRLKAVFLFFLLLSRQKCPWSTRRYARQARGDSGGVLVSEASHV